MRLKIPRRWEFLFDFSVLFLLAAVLIKPLFRAGYLDKWGSIEGSIIADVRFLIAHWPHPQWQPLWYAGTRFDYLYPPLVRYSTAILSMVTGLWPVKAYHFVISSFYCLGIAGVYVFVRTAARSRGMAWLAALATALISPSYLFIEPMRRDAWMMLPERLGVMAKYGDGLHMTALALIPFALACAWKALETFRPVWIALASLGCAVVLSTDLTGGTALVVFYAILVWSLWITHQDKRIVWPALAIVVLGYGLTAFWLVPSCFAVTAENLKYLPNHGTTWSIWIAVAIAVGYALLSDRFALARPERAWAVFTAGCAVFFSLNVLANFYLKFRIAGDPIRLAPELDLAYILCSAAILRAMWRRPGTGLRWLAGVVVLLSFCTSVGYLRHAWQMFPRWPDHTTRVEYRISDWLWRNMPDARVMPSGSVRLWFDAWHDLPQLGGGSDQAILSRAIEQSRWELSLATSAEASVLWLECLGVDAVTVSDRNSEEVLKETANPHKYDAVFPVLFDDRAGNRILRVPRRSPGRIRVVDSAAFSQLHPPRSNQDLERLQAYSDAMEKSADPAAKFSRSAGGEIYIKVTLRPRQSVVLQESYDPAWHAWSGGKPLPIRSDAMGFMAIDASPGDHDIMLAFVTPVEVQVGRILTVFSILAMLALLHLGIREAAAA